MKRIYIGTQATELFFNSGVSVEQIKAAIEQMTAKELSLKLGIKDEKFILGQYKPHIEENYINTIILRPNLDRMSSALFPEIYLYVKVLKPIL